MKAIILAGGPGARLWPQSRRFYPKFLLRLYNDQSLLQATYLRLARFLSPQDIYVVTHDEHKFLVKEDIQGIQKKWPGEENIIAEPAIKNTLTAILVASWHLFNKKGDEPLLVTGSDLHFERKDEEKIASAIKKSLPLVQAGKVVLFGLPPLRADTHYGYIIQGEKIKNYPAFRVKDFVEKPSSKKAETLINQKGVFWNSGLFLFKPSSLFQEIALYQPSLWRAIKNWSGEPVQLKKIYQQLKPLSFEEGLLKKTKKAVCWPLSLKGEDINDWASLIRLPRKEKKENVVLGNHHFIGLNTQNSVIIGQEKVIVTLGLKEMAVIDTNDALLVAPLDKVSQVEEVVRKLKDKEVVIYHQTTPRPWGFYRVLEKGQDYWVKIIHIKPKRRLSLQLHHQRAEYWIVLTGKAKVVKGNQAYLLQPGKSVEIPPSTPHRLENPSKTQVLSIIEIARGSYLAEDDIVRLEDDFKRHLR